MMLKKLKGIELVEIRPNEFVLPKHLDMMTEKEKKLILKKLNEIYEERIKAHHRPAPAAESVDSNR